MTEDDLIEKINQGTCMECRTVIPEDEIKDTLDGYIGGVENLVDELECPNGCDATVIPQIRSEVPLFGDAGEDDSIDDDHFVAAGPATPYAAARDQDTWTYDVDEDLTERAGL